MSKILIVVVSNSLETFYVLKWSQGRVVSSGPRSAFLTVTCLLKEFIEIHRRPIYSNDMSQKVR